MSYTISFASAGQIICSGDRTDTIHLRAISTYAPNNITVSARVVANAVVLRETGTLVEHTFDVRDIGDGTVYTTTTLMAAIAAQIAAMYAASDILIRVSGAGIAEVNGLYVRGEGDDAFYQGRPQWVKTVGVERQPASDFAIRDTNGGGEGWQLWYLNEVKYVGNGSTFRVTTLPFQAAPWGSIDTPFDPPPTVQLVTG